MFSEISPNTQAMLMLTAPLVTGRGGAEGDLLKPSEYRVLARMLRDNEAEPADLMGPAGLNLMQRLPVPLDPSRISRLLNRGFQLSQAVEHWSARAIWVISRADAAYPDRYKKRLREEAPIVLYGVGDKGLLDQGGLAVVGSRDASPAALEHARAAGRLAAAADVMIISGGARGIDQTAMAASLEEGGRAAGILADSLERAALERSSREALIHRRLVLTSPFDPSARFQVGHAMQRNKLVYALADLALVEDSDYNRGGTWAGAVEQLEKGRFVPVLVRDDHDQSKGLSALVRKGAGRWPEPRDPAELHQLIDSMGRPGALTSPYQLALDDPGVLAAKPGPTRVREAPAGAAQDVQELASSAMAPASSPVAQPVCVATEAPASTVACELYLFVRSLASRLSEPLLEREIAELWGVTPKQAKAWIGKLVQDGILLRSGRPARYRAQPQPLPLLEEEPDPAEDRPKGSKATKS
jgi:predicted Rossmann fold nucleotide-binding protein DprA/Smf involved in DNA uptake